VSNYKRGVRYPGEGAPYPADHQRHRHQECAMLAELIDACRRLHGLDGAARTLISLTIAR